MAEDLIPDSSGGYVEEMETAEPRRGPHLTAPEQERAEGLDAAWSQTEAETQWQRELAKRKDKVVSDMPDWLAETLGFAGTVANIVAKIQGDQLDQTSLRELGQAAVGLQQPRADQGDTEAEGMLPNLRVVADPRAEDLIPDQSGGFVEDPLRLASPEPVASGLHGVTYSQEARAYVAVDDAPVSYETYMDSPTLPDGSVVGPSISHGSISQGSFNSTNQRPNVAWTGRIRADSELGRRLLQQFGEEDDNFRKVIEITEEHTREGSGFSYMRRAEGMHGYLALSAREGTQLYLLFDKPENGVQAGVENALSSMVWYMNTTATDIAARWLGVTDTNAEAEGGNQAASSYAGVINNSLGADGFDLLDDPVLSPLTGEEPEEEPARIKTVRGKPFDPANPNDGLATLYALWVTMAQHEAENNLDASELGLENWAKAMKSGGDDYATTGGIGMRTPCFDASGEQRECAYGEKHQEEVPWTDAQVDAFVDTVSFTAVPGGSVTITIGDNSVTFNVQGNNA